jgi:hypothetical protein
MSESAAPSPPSRAEAVLEKMLTIARRELPKGYVLEIKLARIDSMFEGTEVYFSQTSEPEPTYG